MKKTEEFTAEEKETMEMAGKAWEEMWEEKFKRDETKLKVMLEKTKILKNQIQEMTTEFNAYDINLENFPSNNKLVKELIDVVDWLQCNDELWSCFYQEEPDYNY